MSSPATAIKLPSWPYFAEDEVEAVAAVLRSGKVNYWTGTEGREFEREFAGYVGTKHGIAIMNGTVTMELALIALGIGPGDEVIIPPRTFMATATAVMVRGAIPVFADVDRDSGCITAESISRVISPRTKAVIPVHIGGWPSDMKAILSLCTPKGIHVIEDCAQAHGATIDGQSVGSFGVINSWSFCQDKIMTLGGEGGAITVDDDDLWSKMWAYKDHGKSYDAVYNRSHGPGFRWVNEGIGTNWRLTEM
ncbi:MAG: DegT/DnrJ/EryC1/StrS aminotransferase family protein, partial [Fimbriimonadaceae bacterium]